MKATGSEKDYVIRVFDDPAAIDASAWDSLLAASSGGTPFMQHAYLLALHGSASAVAETGWAPQMEFEKGLAATVAFYKENRDWVERVRSGEYQKYYEQNYGGR